MSNRSKVSAAPNYTSAFLVVSGVTLFMVFLVMLGLWGWSAVVLAAWLIDCAIHQRWPWRGP